MERFLEMARSEAFLVNSVWAEGGTDINLDGVHYDQTLLDTTDCTLTGNTDCIAENVGDADPLYFTESDNEPFSDESDDWDTDDVWYFAGESYPILKYTRRPWVTTDAPGDASKTAGTLNGTVTVDPFDNVEEYGFRYGETTDYGEYVTEFSEGFEDSFSLEASGLSCGTVYHYQAYALNGSGTTYGGDEAFYTDACTGGGGGGGQSYYWNAETGTWDDTDPTSDSSDETSDETTDESTDETSDETSDETTDETGTDTDEESGPTTTFDEETGHWEAPDSGETGPSPFTGEIQPISQLGVGWFIRGPGGDTVYMVDEDMHRHPFWDVQTFFTWADSWDDVVWVTDATLQTLPLDTPCYRSPASSW
jgi:hypothetical protein